MSAKALTDVLLDEDIAVSARLSGVAAAPQPPLGSSISTDSSSAWRFRTWQSPQRFLRSPHDLPEGHREMTRRSGSADLPLHGSRAPQWLADRMSSLGAVVCQAIVHHYGREELLARLAHPFWFQSFGAVMGMDWHSSGITGPPDARLLTIGGKTPTPLSAMLMRPRKASACFVFAHGAGAGAGMDHPFMEQIAVGLYCRGIATLRYQFPFMEKGSRRPDPPAIAHAAVRTAVAEARRRCRGMPLVAGGKSFGGRMTSQTQAIEPLEGVVGLAFLGFPLHPPGKPSVVRAEHLSDILLPMLFVQGTRDKLAELDLLAPVIRRLGRRAAVKVVEQADHGFHVPARSGRTDGAVVTEILDVFSAWITHFA